MSILIAVLIFSMLILFHEFGHFLFAKLNHIIVVEFSLGMGPRLFSFEKGGTRYSLKILPFGGSCMMLGEDMDDFREGTFAAASLPARISVVAAGPCFNFLMAFVCSCFIIANVGYDAPVLLQVTEGFPASQAGMEAGDVITSINGKRIFLYREVSDYISFHQDDLAKGKPLKISWLHEGEKRSASLTAQDTGGGRYVIGVSGSPAYRLKASPLAVLGYGAVEVRYWISTVFSGLRWMVSGKVSLDDVSGPVGVVEVIGETYEESRSDGAYYVWLNMLNIVVLLSANLGVMNLLPLPALDGGRLAFLLLEAVRRKRIDPAIEGRINLVGISLLMLLMVIIMFNDIRKIVI